MGVSHADDPFLQDRHGREVHFDAQVSARHHHRVGDIDDRLEVVDRLAFLDLGHDVRRVVIRVSSDQFAELPDIVAVADETQADEVDMAVECPGQVLAVLLCHARGAQGHARQVDALAASHRSRANHPTDHPVVFLGRHRQFHDAIGQQDSVAGSDVVDQVLVGAGQLLRGIGNLASHEDHRGPLLAQQLAAGDLAQSDLGSCQITENPDRTLELFLDLTDGGQDTIQPFVSAVCEVESEHVDPGQHQVTQGRSF